MITVTTTPFALAAGQTMTFTDDDGVLLVSDMFPPDITVAGHLAVVGDASLLGSLPLLSGVSVQPFGGFNISHITTEVGGAITVDASADFAQVRGIDAGGWAPEILNRGTISVIGQRDAYGVYSGGTDTQNDTAVANSGTIQVVSKAASAYGVYMPSGDAFANSGLIQVTGVHAAEGVHFYQWQSTFVNSGTISVQDTDHNSVAVYFNSTVFGSFVNAGTLEGDTALKVVSYWGPPTGAFPIAAETFENDGRMIGLVDLGFQKQVFLNSGSVVGDVNLGSEDDVYDGRSGSVVGLVSGNEGDDSLAGGAGFDDLQGNTGNDTEHGNAGDDWVVGGKDNDILFGDAGGDIVWGNLGADTLDGGDGADQVRGGQGDDVLNGGAGEDYVSGDRGNDTITGGAGADLFHTFSGAGVDKVLDFHLAEGDRVMLDPGTVFSVTQAGADTVIDMGNGDQMILVGVQLSTLTPGWIFGA